MAEVIGFSHDPRLQRILDDVVARAVRLLAPERIWLFGSHAMGTAKKTSDVDLAFEITPGLSNNWPIFVAETQEGVPALVDLDLVDIKACDPALAHEIKQTGQVIYERSARE